MRNIRVINIGILLVLGWGPSAMAQQPLPAPYAAGSQVNSIRTWQAKAPITDPAQMRAAGLREVKLTSLYVDGLGREIQTVVRKGSLPTGDTARDLVSGKVYDSEGRQTIDYLPFSANNAGANPSVSDGNFKANPFVQQTTYYNGRLAGQSGETNVGANALTWAYSQTIYDGSPLDKVAKVLPAGKSWVGSGRGITSNYWTNTAIDNVRMWTVTDVAGDWGIYSSPGAYPPGTLLKSVTTDEHGIQVITFATKAGKVILSKRQGTAAADNGSGAEVTAPPLYSWLCTYYVYDDLDNLRMVIQPQGCELARRSNWNLYLAHVTVLDQLSFRYEYNGRKQVVRKKEPGNAEIYLVYDARGRLVLEQDGNLRNGTTVKWKYYAYDSLNRVTSTGLWNSTASFATLKAAAETSNNYPTLTSGTYEELTTRRYDSYFGLPGGFSATLDATSLTSNTISTSYGSSPEYAEPLTQTLNPEGKLTWESEKVLGTATYLYKVYYYDEKSRVLQVRFSNPSGSISTLSNQYNFAGQVIRTVEIHQKGGTNPSNVGVYTKTLYDDLGRQTYYGQKTNPTDSYKTHATFAYDHLGQLKTKTVGTHPVSSQPLETQDYHYNVRGWLLGVNQPFTQDTTDESRWFGYQLAYDSDGPTLYSAANTLQQKRYNGGISRMQWKSAGDKKIRKYELNYDNLNQLTAANFYQYAGAAFTQNALNFTAFNMAYDYNGNITSMGQYGWKAATGNTVIDAIGYNYQLNGNRLTNAIDGVNDTATLLGDFRASRTYMNEIGGKSYITVDYTYDFNGNQTKDLNKDIDTVLYNYLNLPESVHIKGKGKIVYSYTASGAKLSKVVTDSSVNPIRITTTSYYGQFVYESVQHSVAQPQDYVEKLMYFSGTEGRSRHIGSGVFKEDFFLKDNLGNVRMVLSDELAVDAYPTLSYEGAPGSPQVSNQDIYWDNSTGGSINVAAVRIARPGAFGDTTANGHQVMLLRKSTGSIGATKFLKVMKGDRIHTYVESFYQVANANNTGASGITSLITNLASALSASPSIADFIKPGASGLTSVIAGDVPLNLLLNSPANSSGSNQAPKAYLNVVFFDEQMKPDVNASRVFPIPYSPNVKASIDKRLGSAIGAQRNGYAYVYISNESDEMVYFDNFSLSLEHSPLLEETHYYPYGLPIAAISSKTIGKQPNRMAFNGKEMQTRELGPKAGLEWHDYGVRMYDHQLGRWLAPDRHARSYAWVSPYAFGFNNPMQVNDPTGKDGVVTGSGTEKNPYVVTANYYMYGMNKEQMATFKKAVDQYKNGGKAFKVKTQDGNTVFVKFNLDAREATSKEDAESKANANVVTTDRQKAKYGNTVTVGDIDASKHDVGEGEAAFGSATGSDIVLDVNKMNQAVTNHSGDAVSEGKILEGTGVHEIGHNLGGVHNDPGNIMSNVQFTVVSKAASGDANTRYNLLVSSVDAGGVRAIAGRVDNARITISSRYNTEKENSKLMENDGRGRSGKITTVPDNTKLD